MQVKNYRDIYFYGQLHVDVEEAIAKVENKLPELTDKITLLAKSSKFSEDFYAVGHWLRINEEKTEVYVEHGPMFQGRCSQEKDTLEKMLTDKSVLISAPLKYLEPPEWIHAASCDCGGSGFVGSFIYAD